MNKCNTCALEPCCSISNSNLSYNCPTYTEESDTIKQIKQIRLNPLRDGPARGQSFPSRVANSVAIKNVAG